MSLVQWKSEGLQLYTHILLLLRSTFTHLSVNPHQAILRFQGGGVKIEIRDMNFAGNFQRDVKAYLLRYV